MIVVASFSLYKTRQEVSSDLSIDKDNIEDNELRKKEDEVYKISLVMGGDSLIHDRVYLANYIDGEYDFYYPLSEVKDYVSNFDLAYYNSETLLGGEEFGLSSYPEFNSPTEVGDAFIDAGFNLVSLATNHTLDGYYSKGSDIVIASRVYWLNKYKTDGVISAGSYKSKEDKDEIVIGEINNISYALLSYTYGTNGIEIGEKEAYLVNYIDKDKIKNDVLKYRDKVDLLMVAIHWGTEYMYNPTSDQVDLAHYLADLDVDIVIGNHAHVIEPIEWIDDTLVTYALGNLISGQYFSVQTLTGALCSIDITKTVDENGNSKITMDNLKAKLFYTLVDDRYKVVPYSSLRDDDLENHELYFDFFSDVLKGEINEELLDTLNNSQSSFSSSIFEDDYPSFDNISECKDLIVE